MPKKPRRGGQRGARRPAGVTDQPHPQGVAEKMLHVTAPTKPYHGVQSKVGFSQPPAPRIRQRGFWSSAFV